MRNHWKVWGVMIGFVTLVQIAATLLVPRSFSLTLINDAFNFVLWFAKTKTPMLRGLGNAVIATGPACHAKCSQNRPRLGQRLG